MKEFEVGKWYPTRGGESKRFVSGRTPDGSRLVVCRQDALGSSFYCSFRYLDGRISADHHESIDIIQPPTQFEAEIELAVSASGKVYARGPDHICYGGVWSNDILARKTIKVTLTEGEGLPLLRSD